MKEDLQEDIMIAGIAVRTTNENQQAATDIGGLWQRFFTENILSAIPGKVSNDIFSVYTDYESDHTKPYTCILGCQVTTLEDLPKDLVTVIIKAGTFEKFTAKGNLNKGIVFQKWVEIWNSDLQRKFSADFEVYSTKAQDPENAEVEIYIAVS